MPPTGGPDAVELLLCGHHYRVSAQALLGNGAAAYDLDGMPFWTPGATDPGLPGRSSEAGRPVAR